MSASWLEKSVRRVPVGNPCPEPQNSWGFFSLRIVIQIIYFQGNAFLGLATAPSWLTIL